MSSGIVRFHFVRIPGQDTSFLSIYFIIKIRHRNTSGDEQVHPPSVPRANISDETEPDFPWKTIQNLEFTRF
jgi:hypothetical protein